MENITQEKFTELSKLDGYIIIDVRTKGECSEGIVENAINIDFLDNTTFLNEIAKLNITEKYLVYCRSGNRSGQACKLMESLNFKHTFNLTGGMLAWEGPLVKKC